MTRIFGIVAAAAVILASAMCAGADEAAKTEPELSDVDREHWAYVPPVRPELPPVSNEGWCRTPIDRFVLAKLEAAKLRPAEPADAETWLRRVTFDLTGLPPTLVEIEAFLRSLPRSSNLSIAATPARQGDGGTERRRGEDGAHVAVVDRLLASRAYAERQAQYWLDLARYADSDGYEHDNARPEAWRYRDWVIDAFDRDLPLDEFLRLQLAGDELRPDDPAAAVATGFLLCGPDMPDLNRQDERRSMVLNEMTSTLGSSILGLQLGCAQCHDHKFEPLSHADFYRLRACLETSDFLSRGRQEEGDDDGDAKPETRRVFRARAGEPPVSHLLIRGEFDRFGPAVEPGFPRVANPMQDVMPVGLRTASAKPASAEGKGGETAGRRTVLARWLTRPDHPLTARVLVNRLWQQHFGHGIVRTPSDFGYLGETPTHPELLDWLARFLIEGSGEPTAAVKPWSLKSLHRQIVLSSAYRQSSRPAVNGAKSATPVDPENRLLSHYPRRRLDGDAVRDAMLAASGRLSERRGGPGVMPPLPKELLGTIRKDHWKTSADEEDHRRRTIYLFVRRNLRLPLLDAFDRPDTMASCPRRNTSTTAPQALVLLNSEFSQEAARDLAAYVRRGAGDERSKQIELAYRAVLGRTPRDVERKEAAELIASDADAGLADFCLALFNLNEFVYLE
jgi:hypothetical protein